MSCLVVEVYGYMMTLREFVTKVNFKEHFRVYHPNRDCLIYESYFKIHSPFFNDDEANKNYFDNNEYQDKVQLFEKLDNETKKLLNEYGDYVVFAIECGAFRPIRRFMKDEKLHVEYYSLENNYSTHLPCLDVFIKTR